MKRWMAIIFSFAICATASAFVYTQLLSEEDLEFEQIDNENGRALGSEIGSENPWESYNQWQCLDMAVIEFTCADYDHGTLVPSISAVRGNEILIFDMHVEDRLDCEQTLAVWRELVAGGREICIFAARMPDVDLDLDQNMPQSLWYINRLKGAGGYWNLYESRPTYDESVDTEEAY